MRYLVVVVVAACSHAEALGPDGGIPTGDATRADTATAAGDASLDAISDAPADPFAGIDVFDPASCQGGLSSAQLEQLRPFANGMESPGQTTQGFTGHTIGHYIFRARLDGVADDTAMHAAIYGRLRPSGTI